MTEILSMERGDDKTYELEVTEKKSPCNPADITGCTIKLTIRPTWQGAIFLQKTFTLTAPLIGEAEVEIVAADTSGLTNERHEYVWDVEITKTDTKMETLCKGKFIIEPEVTYT